MKNLNNIYLKVRKYDLVLLILLFLATRFWILSTRELPTHADELYIGTIAKDILSGGLSMFLHDYQLQVYSSGSVVAGILAVPFFFVLGDSYFSLKLLVLSFSLSGFILFLIILNKHLGKKVAVITGLLFTFPSITFLHSSFLLWGTHCESILFSALTVHIFYEIFYADKKCYLLNDSKTYFLFFMFGLISGFSLFFAFIYISILITFLFIWFLLDRSFYLKKSFLFFLTSFLIGFSPKIIYLFTHYFKGFSVFKIGIIEREKINFLGKVLKYFYSDILMLFDFHNRIKLYGVSVIPLFFYSIFLVAYLFVLYLRRDSILKIFRSLISLKGEKIFSEDLSKELFFVVYPIIFSIIYFFSSFNMIGSEERYYRRWDDYRYLIPLYPFIFITLAIFLSRLIQKNYKFKFVSGVFLFTAFLSSGLIGNIRMPLLEDRMSYRNVDGFSYDIFGVEIGSRFNNDIKKYIEIGNKVNHDFRHRYYFGLGRQTKAYLTGLDNVKMNEVKELIRGIDEIYKSYFYEGVGYGYGYSGNYRYYEKHKNLFEKVDESNRAYCYMGFSEGIEKTPFVHKTAKKEIIMGIYRGEYKKYFYPSLGKILLREKGDIQNVLDYIDNFKDEKKAYIYKGIGLGIFSKADFQINKFNEMMELIPRRYRGVCFEEVGMNIGSFYKRNFKKAQDMINGLNSYDKAFAYKGIGMFIGEESGFNQKRCFELINNIDTEFQPYCYEGLGIQAAWRFGDNKEIINLILKNINSKFKIFVIKGLNEESEYSA